MKKIIYDNAPVVTFQFVEEDKRLCAVRSLNENVLMQMIEKAIIAEEYEMAIAYRDELMSRSAGHKE